MSSGHIYIYIYIEERTEKRGGQESWAAEERGFIMVVEARLS